MLGWFFGWLVFAVVFFLFFVGFGLGLDFWFLTSRNNRAIETPTGIFLTLKINKSLGKTLKYLVVCETILLPIIGFEIKKGHESRNKM